MITTTPTIRMKESKSENVTSDLTSLYELGGVAALFIVLTALLEIVITFLPGGYASANTVKDWFALFQNNWFLGLRNLGLLNIVMTFLSIPMFFALYTAHRKVDQQFAALALMIAFLGVAVFYGTNRAFPMLELSHQYALATTDAERAMLTAAGQAMLSVGQSHTPGTFIGFFFSEVASILMSIVMLRSKVFNKATGYTGVLGFAFLLIFDICASFVPALSGVVLMFAMIGGILNLAWYILIARRLFQLAKAS
jgi:hypothetical protein